MSNKISFNYSPNFDSQKRKSKNIKFIIIHYTGMKNDKESIRKLTDEKSSVSCHYFIDRKGKTTLMVPDLYVAWHAGKSRWKKYRSLNRYSIGIELSNLGHDYGYKKFSNKQLKSLSRILKYLIKKYEINLENILGHSDIAPYRKKDPGEKFPWRDMSKKKLCLWHTLKSDYLRKFRNKKINAIQQKLFLKNLSKIGYETSNLNKQKKHIINAFQRRFRPELISPFIDEEIYLISKNLISQ
ncbi:N-acetylmuramoyl-L-alanine amidase [Candidatus Pelagibacter sp.]|nr:N-acetylmuramoyl-L-alanine amidase [Candidatus Pelagibacter sp.]